MKQFFVLVLGVCSMLFLTNCTPTKEITVKKKPPKAKTMAAEDCGDGKQWVSGYYQYKKDEFVWKKGKCITKKEGQIYLPGRWAKDMEGNYTFKPGGWKPVGKKLTDQ